jgi:microcystin degradation protein MlrC
MKIFAAGIATETNTFSPLPTGFGDFVVQRSDGTFSSGVTAPSFDLSAAWGEPAKARGYRFALSLSAWAQPAGITVRSAYECLRDEMLRDLRAALPVDVVLLMLHGAMIAEGYDDCEEDIISRVRQIVGPEVVIGVELDLHCHLSESKIAAADVVITYKEYPHTDVNARAQELFDLAVATRLDKVRPTMALFDCRMIGFYPTSREPLRGFVDAMSAAEQRERVLSVSFGHGFLLADVPHMGAKTLVVTDDDPALAQQVAREFGLRAYSLRRRIGFESLSVPIEVALSKALASERGPVVVADQSDNVGGGAPGDATFALRWLIEHRAQSVAVAILYDPEVVKIAMKVGVGGKLRVRLGGKIGMTSGEPLDLDVTVTAIRCGYMHDFPQQSGPAMLFSAGNVVALRCGGIDVVISSERCQCCSPLIFRDLGIEPDLRHVLIVKSMQHFHGAFAPIAADLIYMAGPGAVNADPRHLAYHRFDTRGMYPWIENPLKD